MTYLTVPCDWPLLNIFKIMFGSPLMSVAKIAFAPRTPILPNALLMLSVSPSFASSRLFGVSTVVNGSMCFLKADGSSVSVRSELSPPVLRTGSKTMGHSERCFLI